MKPRISLILFAYNQEKHIREAALSCLNQQCEQIEIIFSDDDSRDNTYSILEKIANEYKGQHLVRVRKNSHNLGIGGHYNIAILECQGDLIITAAGDDISLPNRVKTLADTWDQSNQKLDLITSHVFDIDDEGRDQGTLKVSQLQKWDHPSKWCKKRPYVIGAAHCFTKRMHVVMGPFLSELRYEDQVMAFRATVMGGGYTLEEPLLKYRRGGLSSHQMSEASPEGYLQGQRTRYERQKVLFDQIHADMLHANIYELWEGKVKRYLDRSNSAIELLNMEKKAGIKDLIRLGYLNGFFWTIRLHIRIHKMKQLALVKSEIL
jgi:glycosyltransferase involved in cell wall biosynthesis